MNLTELFFQNTLGSTSSVSSSSNSSNGGSGFDAILKSAETKTTTTDTSKKDYSSSSSSSSQNKDNNYNKDNSNSQTNQSKNASKDSNNTSVENATSKPVQDTSSVNKPNKTETSTNSETIKVQEEAGLEKMAEVMGITMENLTNIMQDLGLELSDLTEKANVDLLLKSAYDLESDIELLEIPEVTEVLSTIKEVVKDVDMTAKRMFSAEEETTVSTSEPMKQTEENQEIIAAALDKSADKLSSQRNNAHVETPLPTENPSITMATGLAENKVVNSISQSNELDFDIMDETMLNGVNGTTTTSSSAQNALFKTALSNASSMTNVDPQDILKQITDQVKIEIRANITEMKMTLRPEQLGDISLKVVTENGIISAEIKAENEKVKEILESNATQLKELLNQQGIEVSEISVSVNTGDSDQLQQQFYEGQQKNNRRISQILNGIEEEIALEEATEQVITEAEALNSNVEYKV